MNMDHEYMREAVRQRESDEKAREHDENQWNLYWRFHSHEGPFNKYHCQEQKP